MMPPAAGIAIAVPVRNEVERLPQLLHALASQRNAPAFALCLFFDNCSDGSQALVTAHSGTLPYDVHVDCCDAIRPPSAGYARQRAMAVALSVAPHGILLTTDADSTPAPDWIAANLAALAAADIVAGRILRERRLACRVQDRVEAYYERLHNMRRAIDPVPWEGCPSHHWTSGASLAMPAPVYRAIGGFLPRPSGEDALLCDTAARAGYRVRRDAAVLVATSDRRHGRAQHGLAAALATLDGAERLPALVHPDDEAWRFRRQASSRRLHGSGDYAALAIGLCLELGEVQQIAGECSNGEAFAARIVGAPPRGMRMIGLAHAELQMSALEQGALGRAA